MKRFPNTRGFWYPIVFGYVFSLPMAYAEVASSSGKTAPPSADKESLKVIDEAGVAHSLSRDDFLKLPRQKVNTKVHDSDAEFQGASLVDLLKSVGVQFGSDLKGKRAPTVALCDATDGYRVVVTLLEIDPSTADRPAIVADRRDGKPLDVNARPYQLVIPGDKRGIRWIRQLQTIRIVNLNDLPPQNTRYKDATSPRR